jgi:hypothetical protein
MQQIFIIQFFKTTGLLLLQKKKNNNNTLKSLNNPKPNRIEEERHAGQQNS